MKLMVFYRDVEQAEAWMAKYEVCSCLFFFFLCPLLVKILRYARS